MNKYETLNTVGEGAYGIVLRCRNRETGDIVAIKKFKECEDEETVKRTTLREVKILRMLRHANIVQLIEAFRRRGRLHLVFEFVDKNLLEVLTESYPKGFQPQNLRTCIWQIVRALEYCHRHDVIHRDIKPENILVSLSDMCIKLCDFGFARTMPYPSSSPLTDYVATRWYRAPELLLGNTHYTPAIDMFATGCIFAELLDGQPLLPGESEIDQLALIHRVLGPLTKDQRLCFTSHPRYLGMIVPTNPSVPCVPLENKYGERLSSKGLLFLRHLLAIDSTGRITAEQALRHTFFDGIVNHLPRQLRPADHHRLLSLPPRTSSYSRQSSIESDQRRPPLQHYASKVNHFSFSYMTPSHRNK